MSASESNGQYAHNMMGCYKFMFENLVHLYQQELGKDDRNKNRFILSFKNRNGQIKTVGNSTIYGCFLKAVVLF